MYYTPGKKVLTYFSSRRVMPVVAVFVLLGFGVHFLEKFSTRIASKGMLIVIIAGIISCIIAFVTAYMKYKSVQFMFDEFAFHVQKGIIAKSDMAIPYRQIKNVKNSQSLNEKMYGLMHVAVETVGADADRSNVEDMLPVMDAGLALALEKELLARTGGK